MESIKTQQQALPLQLIEWVTITMTFAVLLPSFALLSPERIDAQIPLLYALGWIILPFVAILRLAIWRTGKYAAYLFIMAICLLAGTGLGLFLGQRLLGGILGGIFAGATFLELLYVGGDADAIRSGALSPLRCRPAQSSAKVYGVSCPPQAANIV